MFIFDNYYTFSEIIKLIYATLCTKLFYKGARIIRRPFYMRGKPRFEYGYGFTTGYSCRIEVFGTRKDTNKKLIIGDNCKLGDNVHIAAMEKIIIGKNCLMASKIFISDSSHGDYSNGNITDSPYVAPNDREFSTAPIYIGDNVWIGENVCILKGVTIGDGVIIGANSVVTKSVPANTIAAGMPAKAIKTFSEERSVWESI